MNWKQQLQKLGSLVVRFLQKLKMSIKRSVERTKTP